MNKISYFPVIKNKEQLLDILSRAAWFISSTPVQKIYLPVSSEALKNTEWKVAPGMDPAIVHLLPKLKSKVILKVIRSERDLYDCLGDVSMILRWNKNDSSVFFNSKQVSSLFEGKKVLEVDPNTIRQEGSNYIDVSYRFLSNRKEIINDNKVKFDSFAKTIGKYNYACLMATGPSVDQYKKYGFKDALSIICNSVIQDEELMNTVNPQILVFADPIFHFGPSQYAAKFRKKLLESSMNHDYIICMPLKYYGLFTAMLPELTHRTIGIPFIKDRKFNYDLRNKFMLKATANILTFLMIPLGTTFSKKIGFLGCDGRPLEENRCFWKHNPKTQFNEEMANIQQVHSAFFKIDYNDYYLEHCKLLEEQIDMGEQLGYSFESLAFSHVPALKKRMAVQYKNKESGDITYKPYESNYPRLLLIDSTRVGSLNATGQLKKNFLKGWPKEAFMQIYHPKSNHYPVARSFTDSNSDFVYSKDNDLLKAVEEFEPEVIYYRPLIDKHPIMHKLATQIIKKYPVPLITHIMDDWPGLLELLDPRAAIKVEKELNKLFAISRKDLCISEKMAAAYEQRYGVQFEAIANGVDTELYKAIKLSVQANKVNRKELILRYCGALADNMTLQTIVDIAYAVNSLQNELPIKLEVYTMKPWRKKFEDAINNLQGVYVFDSVSDEDYPKLLLEADVLILGYNFDKESLSYIKYSMPNKLPEYLATGNPVFAVGPVEAAGIDYLFSNELACCVTKRDHKAICFALKRLAKDQNYRKELGRKGQIWAFHNMNINNISKRFQEIFFNAVECKKSYFIMKNDYASIINSQSKILNNQNLIGPYQRNQNVSISEARVVFQMFDNTHDQGVMIDVGAHHGSSLVPFLDKGWRIYAFEPDVNNYEALQKRICKHNNASMVNLDARAVSDKSSKDIPFYQSEISTGISGLSAFHETHQKAQFVDTVTLKEVLSTENITTVDYLKIDTEGHDLFVLKGFPWERFKPAVIECEFEDTKTVPLGYSWKDMADYLFGKGYTVYVSEWHPILRYGIKHDWCQLLRYPCELISEQSWGNILAFCDSINEEELMNDIKKQINTKVKANSIISEKLSRIDDADNTVHTINSVEKVSHRITTQIDDVNKTVTRQHMKRRDSSVIVLGNGPSLSKVNYQSLDHDTIGMNAAFRCWRKTLIYPDYYIGLDTVVTDSLNDEMSELVYDRKRNNIKLFFVRKNILKSQPDLAHIPEVLFFEDYFNTPYFAGITEVLTTGSFAALLGAMLGYRRIYLLGIDLNYTQQIPEAEKINGHILEITETPKKNPNYYFDDYQVKGDRFNIPDLIPDLHYNSWVAVKKRLEKFGVDVINCNPHSKLDIFDFGEVPLFGRVK